MVTVVVKPRAVFGVIQNGVDTDLNVKQSFEKSALTFWSQDDYTNPVNLELILAAVLKFG
jgi:hypothetical protein